MLCRADEPYEGSCSYYEWLTDTFRHKRDVLASGLQRSGLVSMEGQGGFFLMADTSALEVPDEYLRHTTPAAPQARRPATPLRRPPTLRSPSPSYQAPPRPDPTRLDPTRPAIQTSIFHPCVQMTRDWALCRWLALEGGVIAIPSSPFFSANNKELGAKYVRFAFCKADSTLEEASDRIARLVGTDA